MKQRSDGRWQKVKNINGKKVFFYSTEPTEKKAIRDLENQMLRYVEKEEKGKTFAEVSSEWEDEHYKHLQWQTSNRYKCFVSRLNNAFDGKYIKEITANDVQLFFDDLRRLQYSTKTMKDQMSVAKMIFKYASIKEYISKNVTEYLHPPKGKPKVSRESLTNTEIKKVENNIDKDFGVLAYFLLYTGLRKSEALALTYKDIDRKNNVININKSIDYHNNTPHLKLPKTEAGIRCVPLLDNVKKILPEKSGNELLFPQDGKYMTKTYFEKHWKAYCKNSQLNITAHQLRHTFATLLYEWDINVKDSQELLGHSDISTTRNIYTHIRKNRISSTTDKINRAICSMSKVSQ